MRAKRKKIYILDIYILILDIYILIYGISEMRKGERKSELGLKERARFQYKELDFPVMRRSINITRTVDFFPKFKTSFLLH